MNILNTLIQLRDDIKAWVTINLNALNSKIDSKTIPIDSELSTTSTNPVQNKTIAEALNNVPRFSGDYNDLTNAPNIAEDESGNMVITDEVGNIIFKADADGIHTTALNLNGVAAATEEYVDNAVAAIPEVDLTGYATESYVDESIAAIPETDLTNYYTKTEANAAIDAAKEEISESIVSESSEWKIVDGNGNIIFNVDASGAHTTELTLDGVSVETIMDNKIASMVDSAPETLNTLNELAAALGDDPNFATTVATEISNKVDKVEGKGLSTNDFTNEYKNQLDNPPTLAEIEDDADHRTVTDAEKNSWNAKSTFSGDYNDLTNAPNIQEDESGNLVIADPDGNIVFRSDGNGFETTNLVVQTLTVNGSSLEALIKAEETDPTVPDWAKASAKPSYTAAEVGADPVGTAASEVSTHSTATDAHNDIRLLIEGLTTRLNTLADSDDTTLDQMSEIVAYIKSNKSLIEEVTTNKVSVADIIDNLTTNVTTKPLSAAQGVALKALIDALDTDKLDASALTAAVEDALAQAQASGEFKGDAGVGVSSVAQTTTSTEDDGNNIITVTLTNGTTSTFIVQNGSKGSTGDQGDDGYSPVRGTDYWTDADKAEIKSYVDEAILGGAW